MKGREYFSYDGTTCVGRFVVEEKSGKAKAFNAAGRSLGTFDGYDAAREAVSIAYRAAVARKAATAQALEHLNRPTVEFVSGMPSHFLGRRA
jgi:hypothetical protein